MSSEDKQPERRTRDPHFFVREDDGSVRIRIRFEADLATAIENAAGRTPLMVWIMRSLTEAAAKTTIPIDTRPPTDTKDSR